jgi:hypothetical protein
LGIGIGLILGALVMTIEFKPTKQISDAEVENRARGLGMQYPSEFKFK